MIFMPPPKFPSLSYFGIMSGPPLEGPLTRCRKVTGRGPASPPQPSSTSTATPVILRLSDVASGLPPYEEQVLLSGMNSEEDSTGYSQRSTYNTLFEKLRRALADALQKGLQEAGGLCPSIPAPWTSPGGWTTSSPGTSSGWQS